jgi:Brix domain
MEREPAMINGILRKAAPAKMAEKGAGGRMECLDSKPSTTLLLLSLKAPCLCRHLLNDIQSLLAGSTERDSKLKTKFNLAEVLEVAELRGAENVLLIETRKREPLPYFWIVAKSAEKGCEWDVMKFSITGIFTIQELKMPGNPFSCSQMITVFSGEFGRTEGWRRVKRALVRMFNSTRTEAGRGPIEDCVDKVAAFFIVEGTVVARFYHLQRRIPSSSSEAGEKAGANEEKEAIHKEIETKISEEGARPRLELREIGPRFTLIPRESDVN